MDGIVGGAALAWAAGALWLARSAAPARLSAERTALESLVPKLLRAPVAERARRLAEGEVGWASDLAREMLEAPPEARAPVVDAALRDRAHELDARAAWPASAARLAGLGTLLFAASGVVFGAGAVGLVVAVAAGAGSGLACGAIGARAKAELRAWRAVVDRLLDALAGDVAGPRRAAADAGPARRRARP